MAYTWRATDTPRRRALIPLSDVFRTVAELRALELANPFAGLRLRERCSLRIKDLDLGRGEITVRHGKGGKAPDFKKAAHGSCKDCHKKKGKGPTECKDCHVK